jgi:hypothetical protein
MNRKYDSLWPRYAEEGEAPIDERVVEALEDVLQWIYNHTVNVYLDRKNRKINIKIDRWDSWSADHTLALIILPVLKQLQETKHGAPFVDDEDVPEEYRSTNAPPKEDEWDLDEHHFARWDWVLYQMIWAFEQKCQDNWEEDYYEFEDDPTYKEGLGVGFKLVWDDPEGRQAHQERMNNGFRLFGKYYENLWN